ncbi:hypothetical protein FG379_002277 [Cryptosporidium bovis]|uniref:uncharacterized protein n=1 Tax=Cryptosporidium bovis TaxID=310047 RepID=UPI003519EE08|nr:hypothetical protein FG379_002277 [Cryptosporidium bovis]
MSDSLEVFMEDISLLPGWILRNLSLMREIDLKGTETLNKLEEKRSSYLKEIKSIDKSDMGVYNNNKLSEIKNLQKEIRALLREKLAISDQSIHFIRYDGDILRKYFEQLGETLVDNNVGIDHSNGTNYPGRISISDNYQIKNTNKTALSTEINLFSLNGTTSDRGIDCFSGNSSSNSRVVKSQPDNLAGSNSLSQLTVFNNEYPNKSKKRKTSLSNTLSTSNTELLPKSPKNLSIEFPKIKSKAIHLVEKNNANFQACSICGGSELPNNRIVNCDSCSDNVHSSCLWVTDPNLCKGCFKKESVQLKSNYEIGYLVNINTPKSDQAKTSKISKKK